MLSGLLIPNTERKPRVREALLDLAIILAAVVALHYRYLFTAAALPARDVSDALRNLMRRLDEHCGGVDASYDWKEQEVARAVLCLVRKGDAREKKAVCPTRLVCPKCLAEQSACTCAEEVSS